MKKIGIIGYGWLGARIAASISDQYKIFATTTTDEKAKELNGKGIHAIVSNFPDYQLSEPYLKREMMDRLDVLIITIPISEKSCCVSSLYNRIQNLSSFIGNFKGQMFLMSSTGVYPDIEKEFIEDDIPFEKVSGERILRSKYPQVNILRLGGLMGDQRLLKNYNVDNLNFAVNHIHYKDITGIILNMIIKRSEGCLYNVTALLHPSKSQVINAQKNIQDKEGSIEIKGKIVSSSKLVSELDYDFKYPDPRRFHENN